MALSWEVVILFVGLSAALENRQALSQKCLTDTNAFLGEMNQTRPKEYAVQSKCCWLLKRFFSVRRVKYSLVHLQSCVWVILYYSIKAESSIKANMANNWSFQLSKRQKKLYLFEIWTRLDKYSSIHFKMTLRWDLVHCKKKKKKIQLHFLRTVLRLLCFHHN